MFKRMFAVLAAFMLLTVSACGSVQAQTTDTKPVIVTTIFPIYDWVRNIVGDEAEVVCLLNSGVDLHSFQPTAEDIITIRNADMFIYVGGESDEWTEDILKDIHGNSPYVYALLPALKDLNMAAEEEAGIGDDDEEEEEETEYDEHIWLSLKNAEVLIPYLEECISVVPGFNKSAILANSESYAAKINELDAEMEDYASSHPDEFFLFADRFPFLYFMKDYGFSYAAAFKGCSAESEASFETILKLANIIDEKDLDRVFVIEGNHSSIADSVISSSDKKVVNISVVNSLQSITQADIDAGASYLDIMRDNIETFTETE